MKSYLDFVPISAKIHRKQSRMSIFCIILSVFLVTTIFGMADMFVRSQIRQSKMEDGNWHMMIRGIGDEQAKMIAARPEIKRSSCYGVLNYSGELGYTISDKNVIICGSDESFVVDMMDMLEDGSFPKTRDQAMITENTKSMLGLDIGEEVRIQTPSGEKFQFYVSGILRNSSKLMSEDTYGVLINTDSYRSNFYENANGNNYNSVYYFQFSKRVNIRNTIDDIKIQFELSDGQISENTKLLGLIGQSGNSFILQVYGSAAILFTLVLLAGILMITSSLNSNVTQRAEFFGMVRCIGATPKQIMRIVRKEALSWCKFAIPMGLISGIVVIWVLSYILRYLSPEYFATMPRFSLSYPSIVAGIVIGLLTVLLAARAPGKKASKVSPLAAVSGSKNDSQTIHKAANTVLFKVDTALGIHHAKASKKNFILMVGSFSLSIILFLSFSVTIQFMEHTITPMHPWTPDISVLSPDYTCTVDKTLINDLSENMAVKKVYGRKFAYDVPITVDGEIKKVDIISYESTQFDWAKDYLLEGSLEGVKEQENTGLIVYEPKNTIKVGDDVKLSLNGKSSNIKISGMLSESPFNNDVNVGIIICSEKTFYQLTGQSNYTIIDVQLSRSATDVDVDEIHKLVDSGLIFSDRRLDNSSAKGTYYCFALFVYGFLVLIGLITIFNIVNSIAMSVSARTKQYGGFRAIGLSNRQLMKMIIAEASTYAVVGSIFGVCIGLLLNKLLFGKMVSFYWGDVWRVPYGHIFVITIIVVVAIVLAIQRPIKKICSMSIVDTIGAQ